MKKLVFLLFILLFSFQNTEAQSVVNGKFTRWQVEREVFRRWNKFRPYWFYFLFFNRYKRGDKRNVKQLLPTIMFVEANENKSEITKDSLNGMWVDAELNGLDRSTNKRWHLYERREFDKIYSGIDSMISELVNLNVRQDDLNHIRNKYAELKDYVFITNESYLDDSKKAESYEIIKGLFVEFKKDLSYILNQYKSYNKIIEYGH